MPFMGFSGILLAGMRGELPPALRPPVERIQKSAEDLLAIIDDVLDIGKIEAGELVFQEAPLNFSDLIKTWEATIRVLADEKGLSFKTNVAKRLPQSVIGDKQRIAQIGMNLLSNAIKFTDSGEVSLGLHSDKSYWYMTVKDTGIGISPEAQIYIFDEFRQVDGTATRPYGGTGLGLSIVKKFVEAMGGDISVISEVGKGSTFTVKIPLKPTT